MKSNSPQHLQILQDEHQAEQGIALARCLLQAAALIEMRRDGLADYRPEPSLLGPSLRELQAEADKMGFSNASSRPLRGMDPLELCGHAEQLGDDSLQLDMIMGATLFRSGEVLKGRNMYVKALLRADSRAARARCLTSIAAIHLVEGDLVAAASFSRAAIRENPGLSIVQANSHEIEELVGRTGI